MAEVFAPFVIERTLQGLTFYCWEGKNFVRKKSSLTRRKVLYSPQFERTRHYAGLMAKASKIGSLVYNQLPAYWRQFWMYRAFTGEALTMLKAGKVASEIQTVLYDRYVKAVAEKQTQEVIVRTPPKRAYQKRDTAYWSHKTKKSQRRQVNKQRVLRNAGLLGQASKLASLIYRQLGSTERAHYRQLVAMGMAFLRDEWGEADVLTGLRTAVGIVEHREGYRYFVAALDKRREDYFPGAPKLEKRNQFYGLRGSPLLSGS